jgi:F0F1-type ATP synthase epsilon subunit
MKLSLISPEVIVEYNIAWAELFVQHGSLIVQRGHEPMICLLKQNQHAVFKLKTGKQGTIMIANGVAEIKREEIILTVKLAQLPTDLP